jgi:cytochrome c-type biogenesis protein CcmH/NrfF
VPDPEQVANDIANGMPSPYCPGRTIASCPSAAARELERNILSQAEQGADQEQIEQALVERFGQDVMGDAYSAELLLTVLAGAVLGLVAIAFGGRRWLRGVAPTDPMPAGPTQDDLDRLEAALDEVDEF